MFGLFVCLYVVVFSCCCFHEVCFISSPPSQSTCSSQWLAPRPCASYLVSVVISVSPTISVYSGLVIDLIIEGPRTIVDYITPN